MFIDKRVLNFSLFFVLFFVEVQDLLAATNVVPCSKRKEKASKTENFVSCAVNFACVPPVFVGILWS